MSVYVEIKRKKSERICEILRENIITDINYIVLNNIGGDRLENMKKIFSFSRKVGGLNLLLEF